MKKGKFSLYILSATLLVGLGGSVLGSIATWICIMWWGQLLSLLRKNYTRGCVFEKNIVLYCRIL